MWYVINIYLKCWINFSTLWYQGRGQESWERRGCHTNPRSVSNTCTSSHACLMYRHTHLHTFSFNLAAACKLCRQCLLSIYFFHNKTLLMKIKFLNCWFFFQTSRSHPTEGRIWFVQYFHRPSKLCIQILEDWWTTDLLVPST